MATDSLGLYVHIPYCVKKCNYCDFCSAPNGFKNVPDDYVDALCTEILSYDIEGRPTLDTVYFGGGTPSLLSVEQIRRIMCAIRETFCISSDAEITTEANPGAITRDLAEEMKALGFNRISIGLQSIHENELKKLGRIHTYSDFLNTFSMLREVGFENINVDLMYGIPYQTKESFLLTLSSVIKLSPEHISSYGLIVEEGTPFFDEVGELPLPSLDEECDMYDACREMLSSAGYEHYEISNYAKVGKRSRHNLIYWNLLDYIGVGASAHSFYKGDRYANTCQTDVYISYPVTSRETEERDPSFEYAMLKLRLRDGFLLSDYEAIFGKSFTEGKGTVLKRLESAGLLTICDGRISLSERGFYLSNSILVEIL